jgi:hypothetical protein
MSHPPALRALLKVERLQLGVHEKPAGSNDVKYNTAYYGRRVREKPIGREDPVYPWCVVFQWWCFQKAGIPTSIFPEASNVFATMRWYKKRKRFGHKPHVGSLVILKCSHIGLVEKVLPHGRIQTIEGNTDANGSRTGGQVMRRVRSSSSGILGYCNPDYNAAPDPRTVKRVPRKAAPKPKPAMRRPAAVTRAATAIRPAAAPALAPAHTAVLETDVQLPAGRTTAVQFHQMTANTGGFWHQPKEAAGGYTILKGPGVYLASVTVSTDGVPVGATVTLELAQARPGKPYTIVKHVPVGEVDATGAIRSFTAMSTLDAGDHLWLRLSCPEQVTLPKVAADVVLLPV